MHVGSGTRLGAAALSIARGSHNPPTAPLRLIPPLGEPTGSGDALPPALAVMPLRLFR
jgi:hypothetical protein